MTLPNDFAATLVDEWVRAGVREAVVAPGSRSSPLAMALVREARLRTHVRLDERSAGFFAIGLATRSGRPVVVLTTSGTAAAELHPSVVEADLSRVPLIVCTADRPPELQSVGAPQTIDQTHLYGRAVRFFSDPGAPEESTAAAWRSFGARLVSEALYNPAGPGPVHANLAFREPFDASLGTARPGRADGQPWYEVPPEEAFPRAAERLAELCSTARRGVVLAGRHAGDAAACRAFADGFSLALLADSLAFPRGAGLVAAWEPIVKSSHAKAALEPDLVVHLGAAPASRPLSSWQAETADSGARHVFVDPYRRFADPHRSAATWLAADSADLVAAARLADGRDPSYRAAWLAAEEAAQTAIDERLAEEAGANEPAAARQLAAAVPSGSAVVVSSSMPIRDYDVFARPRPDGPVVISNRGANGIDGVASTVRGVAAGSPAGAATVGLLGDLAFFHDLSAHVRGRHETVVDVSYVVLDNQGGGIFDFLPYTGALEESTYERAFSTPQEQDVASVAGALGGTVFEVHKSAELVGALESAICAAGLSVVVVRTDRSRNLLLHRQVDEAVEAAVRRALR